MTLPRLQYPIVLVHGLGAIARYGPVDYFYGLPSRLKAVGNQVLIAELAAWQTVEQRAAQLADQIKSSFPRHQKINLIGHSIGGLDARYFASRLDTERQAASVTTIGTPHRGTQLADWITGAIPKPATLALDQILGFFEGGTRTFEQLTPRYLRDTFNPHVLDAPGTQYFSAMSCIGSPILLKSLPIFWLTHPLLQFHDGANDGFVSERSARWGTQLALHEGDHYAQIGQLLGRSRGMNFIGFYEEIFAALSHAGL